MVRRDEASPRGPAFRCSAPAGASPASVSPGAPSSRPQACEETRAARAGCQKPLWRKPARGPQHHVKPAASTDKQFERRAGHVAAKATSGTPQSGDVRAPGLDGVGGVARVHGAERNTRGPSARLGSEQVRSYKPMAKTRHAQRASEGVVVPRIVATNDATGGKGPCGGQASDEGTCEGMAGKSGPNSPGRHPPLDNVRHLQRSLWVAAKRSPERRFHALMDRIWRGDILQEAWRRVRRNRGAAGVDRRDAGGDRAVRRRADALPSSASPARRHVSAAAGPAAVHSEGRWPTAAARHPDGPGPGGADGGEAGAGADLRGGLSARRRMGFGRSGARRRRWKRCGCTVHAGATTCWMRTSATTSGASTRRG